MAPPPVEVEIRTGRADEQHDVVMLLRHQESMGGVILRDGGQVVHAVGWTPGRRTRSGRTPWVLTPPRLVSEPTADQVRTLVAADAVVVRTSQQRDVAHSLGVPWYRLFVVPVAADAETFRRSGPAARNTERFRIVAESTGPDDGIPTLLSAVAAWEAIEVVVIAEQRGATLRREAGRRGLGARFLAVHPRDEAERAWWIRSAHTAVTVPSSGVPPRLALDAMACGVPVVATPVDQLEDLVVHGVTGLHVPSSDPLSLARAVRSIVSDPFRLEAFGMAAADRALNRYSPERVGRDLVAVYRRVLSGQPGVEEGEEAGDYSDRSADPSGDGQVELDGAAR